MNWICKVQYCPCHILWCWTCRCCWLPLWGFANMESWIEASYRCSVGAWSRWWWSCWEWLRCKSNLGTLTGSLWSAWWLSILCFVGRRRWAWLLLGLTVPCMHLRRRCSWVWGWRWWKLVACRQLDLRWWRWILWCSFRSSESHWYLWMYLYQLFLLLKSKPRNWIHQERWRFLGFEWLVEPKRWWASLMPELWLPQVLVMWSYCRWRLLRTGMKDQVLGLSSLPFEAHQAF